MKDKGHFIFSLVKSGMRIISCGLAIYDITNPAKAILILAGGLLIAELVGIIEEIADKR